VVYSGSAKSTLESRRNQYQTTLLLTAGLRSDRRVSEWDFTLEYTDKRRVHPLELQPILDGYGFPAPTLPDDELVEASLTCTAPPEAALAWCNAPQPGDASYDAAWRQVSRIIQNTLRVWVPFLYLSQSRRYADIHVALPLLVYGCSQPPRSGFAYDVMDRDDVARAVLSAGAGLHGRLGSAASVLRASGQESLAAFYDPERTSRILGEVLADPRLIKLLLGYDARITRALMHLSRLGASLKQQTAHDPGRAAGLLARYSAGLVTEFHANLENIFTGKDLVPLGSLLLVAAANGLVLLRSPTRALLRIRSSAGELQLTNYSA
jgi:hypothetical protein